MKLFKNTILFLNIAMLATMLIGLYQAFLLKSNILMFLLTIVLNIMYMYRLYGLKKLTEVTHLKSLDKWWFKLITFISALFYFFVVISSWNYPAVYINAVLMYVIFYFFSIFNYNFVSKESFVIYGTVYSINELKYIRTESDKNKDEVKINLYYPKSRQDYAFNVNKKEYSEIINISEIKNKIRY